MPKEIAILHISDLHARVVDRDKIRDRAVALLEDVERQSLIPDVVLFTADIAFSGKEEEYALAEELLFHPMERRLRVSKKKVYVIPGNHDVDRALINSMEETGLKKNLKTSEDAAAGFRSSSYATGRLQGFIEFFRTWPNAGNEPFSSHVCSIRGFEVGIACLNSAWRCSGDKDKHKLFLTHEQVNVAADTLEKCVLRVALVHHPFEWYHPKEADIIEDLKRRFEVILSGHLHQQVSIAEQTTSHDSLFLTVPALFEGFGNWEGYNVYRIDVENRTIEANFRKFVRKRNEFDADTAHARGGRHTFPLPVRDISKFSRAVSVQRIDACKTRLQSAIKDQLQIIQKVPNPVLVTPKIAKISWSNGARIRSALSGSLADIARSSSIIFGPRDSGKTILLQSLAADLNEARASQNEGRMAVYADCSSGCYAKRQDFEQFLDRSTEDYYPGETLQHAVILLDELGDRETSARVFDYLPDIAVERDVIFVAAIGSDLLFEALPQKAGYSKWDFYELNHWGPSRIREFVTKYFEGTTIDVDAAYNFVSASLEDTDLPATPWVIALYLSIFPSLGKHVSSLSFLRLLEKIEEDRLGKTETSSADSLYNKREILMRLACMCLERESISIDLQSFRGMIEEFFKQKYLKVDLQGLLQTLRESGLVALTQDSVRFTYFAFYDYFLARAFERNLRNVENELSSLRGCLSVGQALCLYGGLFRENVAIARKVLGFVGTLFESTRDLKLEDLDKYINSLLLNEDQKTTADEIADRDLRKRVNYEAHDEEFERRKSAQVKQRSRQFTARDPTSIVEQLGAEIVALKTFYNLFRNLENIDGDEKVRLLDQVLEFHIQCTVDLIQFLHQIRGSEPSADFQCYVAYIVTMGGQCFLSNNIANQSLEETIRMARKTCTNDLKQLLLVCLYSDLRLHGYQRELEDYVKESNSLLAAELIYLQTRLLLITHESRVLPSSIIAAFQAAFRRRHELLGGKEGKGSMGRSKPFDRAYSDEIEFAKKQHLQFFNAREDLIRTSLYD